jgi:hypothetical protein
LAVFTCGFCALTCFFTVANAADIAIVDFADQWTKADALRQTLDEFGIKYDDLTKDIEKGSFSFKDQGLFFIGSMRTNNATLHQNLDKNAKAIQDFVKRGGIVIEPTQADQNEANVDWLPDGLVCVRSDPDSADFKIKKADHPLFNAPNKMVDKDFAGWGHQGWPTVWEVIATQKGFDAIAESQGNAAIMEGKFGSGLFVMMCLAPDKYHIVGNDDNTKKMAGRFMENILETYTPKAVEATGKLATTWGRLKSASMAFD